MKRRHKPLNNMAAKKTAKKTAAKKAVKKTASKKVVGRKTVRGQIPGSHDK